MLTDVLELRYVNHVFRQKEVEEAAFIAAGGGGKGGGSSSSRSGKTQRVTFGADDLLAALTWVVVQVYWYTVGTISCAVLMQYYF